MRCVGGVLHTSNTAHKHPRNSTTPITPKPTPDESQSRFPEESTQPHGSLPDSGSVASYTVLDLPPCPWPCTTLPYAASRAGSRSARLESPNGMVSSPDFIGKDVICLWLPHTEELMIGKSDPIDDAVIALGWISHQMRQA